jgi:tRNA pseudouridine55 synthase
MILVDKPKGWTSADVVAYLKKKNKLKKVGHAGTLDPMATGLLIILVDKETKRFDEFQKLQKEYGAEIELGYETDTGDGEGKVTKRFEIEIEIERIKQELKKFEGEQMQTPPIYSAVKIKGTPAYKLARRGQTPELKAKRINVYKAELIRYTKYDLRYTIKFIVSSGTYIRSLAVDLGRKLGTGATLVGLRRTRIGEYRIEDAETI